MCTGYAAHPARQMHSHIDSRMQSERAFLTAKRNAYQHVTKHDWVGAAQDLGALSTDARFSAKDWLSLAIASIHAGSLVDAARAARRALAEDPDNFRVVQVLTIALMEQHRWSEVVEVFESHGHLEAAQASEVDVAAAVRQCARARAEQCQAAHAKAALHLGLFLAQEGEHGGTIHGRIMPQSPTLPPRRFRRRRRSP